MHAKIIVGGVHKDSRGILKFFNDFDMSLIKRFYISEHSDVTIVRAWQGHRKEQKWFFVTEGSFKLVLVEPDSWTKPSTNLSFQEFVLEAKSNEIINIPAGFATGFQALESSSKMVIFSDVKLEASMNDDYRFDKNLWYKWS